MNGQLRVVGLGPGPAEWITPESSAALAAASDIVGYHAYVSRLTVRPGQKVHASDNREELMRARQALELAAAGARVVVVSGGDPGVFAMAAALFEALEAGPAEWRALEIAVLPGVTAMLAAAARLGAPLGNDFCAINLSDNLKPWSVIERRLSLAAQADFVIALYNPASRSRREQLRTAFEILRRERAPETLVVFAAAIGRPDEQVRLRRLVDADPELADMRTLVLIGASGTRSIERPGALPYIYTPRGIGESP
ncbi:MAG TPA: precorrin-3B C(17)-methyltransferase [Polyangiales bacterium]|nr:precorrin-3B C(17)-methyltransferase [Polyangiales bacterium]